MSHPAHTPDHSAEFDELAKGLDAALHADLQRSPRQPLAAVQRPATPAPAGSAGRGPGAKVGPPENPRPQLHSMKQGFTRRYATPFDQLVEVVDDAYRLRQEVELLIAALTGEEPVPVKRLQPMGPVCGLLPNVARVAAEIGAIHGQISDRIAFVKETLG